MSDSQRPRPVIGVGVLVWREKQLLLGKRVVVGKQSCWQFPGGHLENGESVVDCARREVQEETSLKIKNPHHLGFTGETFAIGSHQYITLLISSDYDSGDAKVMEPEKCECWQWFDYQQLPEPLFEPVSLFLSQSALLQQGNLYAMHRASAKVSFTG